MSRQDSTTTIKSKQRKFYPRSRATGRCTECQGEIFKGSPTWWSGSAGWQCTACNGNETAESKNDLVSVYRCKLVKDTEIRFNKKANTTTDAGQVAAQFLQDSPNERFIAILLNTKLDVIGVVEITSGVLDASLVHPRETFRPAIIANASAIIVAHNHPSGELTPSREDWAMFKKLKEAGDMLGIRVLDSVITSDDLRFESMASIS